MPALGFGTFTLKGDTAEKSVATAISLGYRLIDTAAIYGNEEAVGAGIRKSGVDRSTLFITTKLWESDAGYENAKKVLETSMKKLGVKYVDLYLIHWPRGDIKGSWKAMEALYEAGKAKAIGVSNFEPEQLKELMKTARIKPMVNQIEFHPFFQQKAAQEANEKLGIKVQAWSPFAQGRNNLFTNPTLQAIAKKHNKTVAQVTLRWEVQNGLSTIPRTSERAEMAENLGIFDFTLDAADMEKISTLDTKTSLFPEWRKK
ncbi:aldo/keto reductase [Oxalobacter vibrioformis]|uniref:Aldo/keto reductase n=2 Tax=Oxalobacter vibrioformis TaxID=933080 RepID=A0A9E9M1D4_9BURK|nr:aldo/keto reductase [Oxalobacter vibrioformis]